MKDVYQKLAELFEKERFSVLATIINQTGSSPRSIGTKCLVMDNGSLAGTIGGGILEAQVLKEARKVFNTRLPVRLYFSFKGADASSTDMLCGGQLEIFLEPVSPKNTVHLSIFQKCMKITNKGGPGLLATVIDQDAWLHDEVPKMFLGKNGESIGSLPGGRELKDALLEKIGHILDSRQPVIFSIEDDGGNQTEIFVEPISSIPVLYVFGGGHISKQIVPLASSVGFHMVVIDDREEFADSRHFPEAKEAYQYQFDGVMDRLPVDESSYLVIVTRGHIHDKAVLAQALRSKARYIGMIGSKRKKKIIFDKLLEEGFREKDLCRVHTPIGIEIGAETPEEIAVSIVAELIKVRAGGCRI
jgi:xanthine dehydrogenase accessory factor